MAFSAPENTSTGELTNRSGAVAPEALLARGKKPGTLLIDIRSRRAFGHSHVPGSHSVPAGLLLSGEPPEGDLVLIGTDSHHSQQLIEQLHEQGYHQQLQYLEGGFHDWVIGSNQNTNQAQTWRTPLVNAQQWIAGPLLLITAATTQSLGLLAVGFILLFAPWSLRRGRA